MAGRARSARMRFGTNTARRRATGVTLRPAACWPRTNMPLRTTCARTGVTRHVVGRPTLRAAAARAHYTAPRKLPRTLSCSNRRPAVVKGRTQVSVVRCEVLMVPLRRRGFKVVLALRGQLVCRRTHLKAARTAVEARVVIHGHVVDNSTVVDVGH